MVEICWIYGRTICCSSSLQAAAAAHMAVHCHGRRQVRLHEDYITTSSTEEVPEIQPLSMVKAMAAMASAETARNIDVLLDQSRCKSSFGYSEFPMTINWIIFFLQIHGISLMTLSFL